MTIVFTIPIFESISRLLTPELFKLRQLSPFFFAACKNKDMYHIQSTLYDWRIVIKPVLVATVLHYLFPFMHGVEKGEEGLILAEMWTRVICLLSFSNHAR
jgi:hypothetical protein